MFISARIKLWIHWFYFLLTAANIAFATTSCVCILFFLFIFIFFLFYRLALYSVSRPHTHLSSSIGDGVRRRASKYNAIKVIKPKLRIVQYSSLPLSLSQTIFFRALVFGGENYGAWKRHLTTRQCWYLCAAWKKCVKHSALLSYGKKKKFTFVAQAKRRKALNITSDEKKHILI